MTSSTSRLVTALLLFSCVLAWSRTFAAAGQPPADSNRDGQLTEKLDSLVQQHAGQVGMAVKHLTSGYHFEYRATEPMPTASLIKFPLLIAAYQAIEAGEIGLQDPITLHESDKVPGSGILTAHFSEGVTLPLGDVMRLMMVYSDNTATNLVIDHVGLAATSQLMEQLGCPETKLHSQTYRRDTSLFPDRSQRFGLGSTTAAEMVKLLELLQQGRLVSPAASESIRQTMLACDDDTKLARYLPAGVKVANKSGAVSASRTDAALIETPSGPIAICVLTTQNEDRGWGPENAAEVLCGEIGRAVYQHFHGDQPPDDNASRKLTMGSDGELVEALQRTLNQRLEPSPELNVDGDFGPATQGAVIRFQQSRGLTTSGEVDADTWQALGTLLTGDQPVPPPEQINSQPLEKRPADPLDGQPFVTCQAWAIADAVTGQTLWQFNGSTRRAPASTTKIMTAYLITSLAASDPSILDEVVVFSQAADETIGSTCGLRAGEQIPVRELLYGLLLPSGNDASVALAEHFGDRLVDGDSGGGQVTSNCYQRFVQAMNDQARQLGMDGTRFTNTHGLTEADHYTTAEDLSRLTCQAMRQPLFAGYVRTRRRGCQVAGPGGYRRNVVWNNTNELLELEGYDGVKTGTTDAAGSCLVSHGQRGEQQLIVVVLGSAASEARYADTRNLFRWAWQQSP